MREDKYYVLAGRSQEDVQSGNADVERKFDTLKEARAYAKYQLTEEAMRSAEASEPLNYAAVFDSDTKECLNDYFRRGY